MILVESINVESEYRDYQAFDSRSGMRMNQRVLAENKLNIAISVTGADAENVINAINSDGTIYPDKVIQALNKYDKKGISNEPIKLTRGIDL